MSYISFAGMERYNNQRLKNKELEDWVLENVDEVFRNYAAWGVSTSRSTYLCGITLDSEQAVIVKLKFGL
jgi:hypothetical protein